MNVEGSDSIPRLAGFTREVYGWLEESERLASAEAERAAARAALEAVAGPVMLMSGVAREGVTDVLRALRAEIEQDRADKRAETQEATPWRPCALPNG